MEDSVWIQRDFMPLYVYVRGCNGAPALGLGTMGGSISISRRKRRCLDDAELRQSLHAFYTRVPEFRCKLHNSLPFSHTLSSLVHFDIQPLRLDIKKKLSASSERVKSVDLHNSEPWVLAALYSGNVMIWDYESGSLAKSFEVSELPVRCAKFVERKQWFIAASDDMRVRVFNYNTMEKIKEFEGHADYIRSLEVHPTLPYVLSSSDDMTIKLWDWDRGFDCTQMFEGHAHYVMQVKINPKDTNTFASASLDRSIKVWGLGSHVPHYTLEGHERGVNCLDYYPSGDKPYILSGADDRTVKIWDYQVRFVRVFVAMKKLYSVVFVGLG